MKHKLSISLILITVIWVKAIAGEIKDPDIKWLSNLHQQLPAMLQQHQAEAAQFVDTLGQSRSERYPACCSVRRHPLPARVCQSAPKQSSPRRATGNDEQRYGRLMVLASFSMPMSSLQVLALQLQKVGGQLVLRGLVNNSFKATAAKLQQLGQAAIIDSTLFQALNINQVPTFVHFVTPPIDLTALPAYDQLQGHVTLIHALEQFAARGEVAGAEQLLQQLQSRLP